MIVSLLRECLPGELRVLLLPKDAVQLCEICDLQVETGAGRSLGIPDDAYVQAGARITGTPDAWGTADLLLKLKAPTLAEVRRIRCGGSIAALFHAEGTPGIVTELLARKITAYSFEYFQDSDGAFPLMAATGEIAGQHGRHLRRLSPAIPPGWQRDMPARLHLCPAGPCRHHRLWKRRSGGSTNRPGPGRAGHRLHPPSPARPAAGREPPGVPAAEQPGYG